jgi:Protein tyrosine and serine/threonine kinase
MLLSSVNDGSTEYVVKAYDEKQQIFRTLDDQYVIKMFNDKTEYNDQVDLYEKLDHVNDAGDHILMPIDSVVNKQTEKMGFVYNAYSTDLETPQIVKWKLSKTIEFALKIAKSLFFLHENVGICHGDFHGGNVVMNETIESCRLIDITHGMERFNPMSEPPEQLIMTIIGEKDKERLKYAFQRDVWSFAIFLIEQISGKKIFERHDYEELNDPSEPPSPTESNNTINSDDSSSTRDWDTFGCHDEFHASDQLHRLQCYFELSDEQKYSMNERRLHWKSVFENQFVYGLYAQTEKEISIAMQFRIMVFVNMCEANPTKRIEMSKVVGLLSQWLSELSPN